MLKFERGTTDTHLKAVALRICIWDAEIKIFLSVSARRIKVHNKSGPERFNGCGIISASRGAKLMGPLRKKGPQKISKIGF